MVLDSGVQLKDMRVDGGATANKFLMQFQSDILDTPVVRPENKGEVILCSLCRLFISS